MTFLEGLLLRKESSAGRVGLLGQRNRRAGIISGGGGLVMLRTYLAIWEVKSNGQESFGACEKREGNAIIGGKPLVHYEKKGVISSLVKVAE